MAEVKRVPANDDGGKEVQAGYAEMLVLQCHLALSRIDPEIGRNEEWGYLPAVFNAATAVLIANGMGSAGGRRATAVSELWIIRECRTRGHRLATAP